MIKVIYWSGTGNTKAMAELIEEGMKEVGRDVELHEVGDVEKGIVDDADILVLGCPSMGAEELEESEMEPFIESIKESVVGKKVTLFGSYGWGEGEWMDTWKERMIKYGADMICDPLIVNEAPEGEAKEECILFGKQIAG